MNAKLSLKNDNHGGALIVSVFTVAVLAMAGAAVLSQIGSKYRSLSQATSWRKALGAAESGTDFAMQKLNDSVTDPTGAWTGWSTTDPSSGATLPYSGKVYTATALTFGGEGGNSMNFQVIVDSPPGLAAGGKTKQYYRIRSTGYVDLPGSRGVTNSSLDATIRKLSLLVDRKTGQKLSKPRASRTIEIVAAPETETKPTNSAAVGWSMDSYKNQTLAFDSSDPAYSTAGRYDPAKQVPTDKAGILLATNQWTKDGATKGTLGKVDLKNSFIYGDFGLVGGPVKNGGNVQGDTVTNYYTELPKVLEPSWTTLTDPSITKIEGSPTTPQKTAYATWYAGASVAMKAVVDPPATNKNLVLYGGSIASSPTTFKVTQVKLDGKDKTLAIANPPGKSESWVEIWATDEFTIKNGAVLAIEDGVHATIHFESKLKIKDTKKDNGGAFVMSGFAGDLVFRGIEEDESKKVSDDDFSPTKTSGKVKIKDSQFTGVVFAPDYDMDLKTKNSDYPATQQYIMGAITGRKVKFKGDTDFITDLAIAQAGKLTGYKVASWFEDSE